MNGKPTGRPKIQNPKNKTIRFRMAEDEVDNLKRYCIQTNRTASDVIRDAVDTYILRAVLNGKVSMVIPGEFDN